MSGITICRPRRYGAWAVDSRTWARLSTKDHLHDTASAVDCRACQNLFTCFRRKRHCRHCGSVVCRACLEIVDVHDTTDDKRRRRTVQICIECCVRHVMDTLPAKSARGLATLSRSHSALQPPTRRRPNGASRRLEVVAEADTARLEDVCKAAAAAYNCPMAGVSLVDGDTERCIASHGFSTASVPRATAFGAHVVQSASPVVVLNTGDRDHASPMAAQFYAGVPLHTSSGAVGGTLFVLDTKPRTASVRTGRLEQLASMASDALHPDESATLISVPVLESVVTAVLSPSSSHSVSSPSAVLSPNDMHLILTSLLREQDRTDAILASFVHAR
ncbi:hypothetical protein SPRG_03740 [Saprolegnia parasitica CBS 223.65]|uniref:FYVE-type domain-containing protein n=1 Tax=Saprolegnia parasitica (strain CBS 223.65) TaxID=695850 RepID=A0A067CRF2_SAPPC|nr:hypothetical protein SPRG_03740 [Saprolegnia parasitica CBS 223.65]KDO31820.1 hypothetical protein SPRG_03740 [Saprolegnia parasitica CBS 223.65]|eukprot:XP_012197700.1 hypothetical protein SPRG_03740 [Saprolegnia parasitica CBS 223.65]